MAFGTARSRGSSGENISHFTGIRMRVTGNGTLKMKLQSLDDVRSLTLIPFTMASSTNIEPFRLCNFMEQRVRLEVKTNLIYATFRINRIIIYAKETFTSYPG